MALCNRFSRGSRYRVVVRRAFVRSCVLATLSTAFPVAAQTPPTSAPPPPPVPTRHVVFLPDRPQANLEFYGIDYIDGGRKVVDWFPVCVGPCAQQVPISGLYRVGGKGIVNSDIFAIQAGSAPLGVTANTGSASATTWGAIATAAGGAAILVGLSSAVIAGICNLGGSDNECTDRSAQRTGGLVVAGIGTAVLATGLAVVMKNRTFVSVDEPSLGKR